MSAYAYEHPPIRVPAYLRACACVPVCPRASVTSRIHWTAGTPPPPPPPPPTQLLPANHQPPRHAPHATPLCQLLREPLRAIHDELFEDLRVKRRKGAGPPIHLCARARCVPRSAAACYGGRTGGSWCLLTTSTSCTPGTNTTNQVGARLAPR